MNDVSMSMSTYATQDLPLAATFVALGHSLIGIERTNPKRAGFCFTLNSELEVIIDKYHSGKVRIEPRTYFDAIRQLKNRLYGN